MAFYDFRIKNISSLLLEIDIFSIFTLFIHVMHVYANTSFTSSCSLEHFYILQLLNLFHI